MALALVHTSARAASPGQVACLDRTNGPCQTPDMVSFLPTALDSSGTVVTNFGLLLPGDKSPQWQLVCDDNFGVAQGDRVRAAPDGRVFAGANDGIYYSADGCTWQKSGGPPAANNLIWDIAFNRQDPMKIFALANFTRTLLASTDGGKTFAVTQTFTEMQSFDSVVVAPSDGQRIYLTGVGGATTFTPFAVSTDGGATFTIGDLATHAATAPRYAFQFAGIAPDDPLSLYFFVVDPAGDEVWKTSDGGQSIAKVLKLLDGEQFKGLAFGATSQAVYVAGYNLLPLNNEPPGRLYISHDATKTWLPPVPSAENGPRYACLAAQGNKLYACGLGAPMGGDDFLVGESADEGKTWTPTVRFNELAGAKSCVKSKCARTEIWLCESYCQCPADMVAPETCRTDGGAPDASAVVDAGAVTDAATDSACVGTACVEKQGCSCALGARSSSSTGLTLPFALAGLGLLARRRRRPRR